MHFRLLVAFALVVAVHAQDQPQPTFRTDANFVRVDVYPTAGGAPVADLTRDDFEIFDNGVPQAVDTFEHVTIAGGIPQELRREPTTVAASRAQLENPRARIFVLFLDSYHVDVAGSRNLRDLLADALDRLLGPEDLFAVMTPEMSARDLSFARKTTTTRGMLEKYWAWGERDQLVSKDPQDEQYRQCYPENRPQPGCLNDRGIAEEMIERRRETLTLDAVQDLVRYLRGAREERKAVLVLSSGWRLFRPSDPLARAVNCQPAGGPSPIGVDPRAGRPTIGNPRDASTATVLACDRDRMQLAQIDDDQKLRDILAEANRANTTFYPIEPRGLVAFDEPIARPGRGGRLSAPPPPGVDAARLRARHESLRAMASDTDGLAVLDSNDLERGFSRIVADLSSYYLLGYYATTALDGKYHEIRVRVKRPGVQVRARRGYRAPSAAEATAAANRARRDSGAPLDAAALEARAVETALAPLNSLARDRPLRLHAAAGWRPLDSARGGPGGAVWAVGELSTAAEWKGGADIDVALVGRGDEPLVSRRVALGPGMRTFAVMLASDSPLAPGDYTVNVRARGRAADAMPVSGSIAVSLRPQPAASAAIMVRRGPTTGNRELPTADIRFRRTEQLRVEVPALSEQFPAVRLLDRTGKPLPVPVTAGVRDDADGARWHTAHLVLAPLAPGDYVIEIGQVGQAGQAGQERRLVGFRIVP